MDYIVITEVDPFAWEGRLYLDLEGHRWDRDLEGHRWDRDLEGHRWDHDWGGHRWDHDWGGRHHWGRDLEGLHLGLWKGHEVDLPDHHWGLLKEDRWGHYLVDLHDVVRVPRNHHHHHHHHR
jgi:hypothetical protein